MGSSGAGEGATTAVEPLLFVSFRERGLEFREMDREAI